MSEYERMALLTSVCVLCGHALIDHHETSLCCQHSIRPHWWSRRVKCPCDMTKHWTRHG